MPPALVAAVGAQIGGTMGAALIMNSVAVSTFLVQAAIVFGTAAYDAMNAKPDAVRHCGRAKAERGLTLEQRP